jgi:hypothetical protein
MALSQIPSEIKTDPSDYLTLIIGVAGVGKTSFAAQWPNNYFLITEAGTEGVEVYGHPVTAWDTPEKDSEGRPMGFIQSLSELMAGKEVGWKGMRPVKTVTVDNLDVLYRLCGAFVVKKYTFPDKGVAHKYDRIEDVPFGKGYDRTNEILVMTLENFMLHGFGVILTSHTKERNIKWAGQDLDYLGPNLPPSGRAAIVGACGAVGHFVIESIIKRDDDGVIRSEEQRRVMYWQPAFLREAKHRLKGFPECLPLERDKGYETYLNAFNEAVEALKQTITKSIDSTNRK